MILLLLFLQKQSLVSIRKSLEMVGLADGLMCVRMMEERRFDDRAESILTSDIDKLP
jgi:hypothetical protein